MSVARLSEKAILVSLKVSKFTGTKEDKKISREVASNHNATEDAGRYQK